MDLSLFLGRLHPLVVHLPIGFLLLAMALEWFGRKNTKLQGAIGFTLLLGALSAVLATIFGLLLKNQGGYNGNTLNLHQWFGILVAVLSFGVWAMKTGKFGLTTTFYNASMILLLILITLTGHFGGSLTHGADYLTAAFKSNNTKEEKISFANVSADSVEVYRDLIRPILTKNCIVCHNANKTNGGLRLDSLHLMMEGGDGGAAIIKGVATDSELFKRITLSSKSSKYMPPKGKMPLSFNEIRLIEWWINSGADGTASVMEIDRTDVVKELLEKKYELDLRKKSYAELVKIEAVSETILENLKTYGFKVSVLAQNNVGLEVGVDSLGMKVTEENLTELLTIKDQIVFLNLEKTNLTDDLLSIISQFSNLTRLRIQNNPITDKGIAELTNLVHLESLNLYGTKVTDVCIEDLKKIKTLQHLYIWQTEITEKATENLKRELVNLEIEKGFEFKPIEEN